LSDWRAHGQKLAAQTFYEGHFDAARKVMLDAWEGWTSGEPPREEVVYELLATWWAMAMASGLEELGGPLKELADKLTR